MRFMLNVITLEEAKKIIFKNFVKKQFKIEEISLRNSMNRILAEDIISNEDVPGFNRSSVDGYAVISKDINGCSETIPAMLEVVGTVEMGEEPSFIINSGQCAYVPTGGCIPIGADSMVMVEYTEKFSDEIVCIYKPEAPGTKIIYRGDDVKKGEYLINKGTCITCKEIGVLSLLGYDKIKVFNKPKVAVISTGDELIPINSVTKIGKVRDVNGMMFITLSEKLGCEGVFYGIQNDDYNKIKNVILKASNECDLVIVSGATSIGEKDVISKIIEEIGVVLLHGIAIKPGKPTVIGKINDTMFFGLPGHPIASFFMYKLLVVEIIMKLQEKQYTIKSVELELVQTVPSNHGKEEYILVKIEDGKATPIIGKSGLITMLINADGYIKIERNCEGYKKGKKVLVNLL